MKRKGITWALALLFLFSFAIVPAQDIDSDETGPGTELVMEPSNLVQLEHKEAYKLDDAEFITAVATKFSGVQVLSMAALLGIVALFFSSRWEKISRRAQIGLSILVLGIISVVDFGFTAATMAIAPFIKFDKTGLEGDNLKFVEDLEKRIKAIGHDDLKALLADDMKLAVREATKMFDTMKDLKEADIAKMKELLGEDEKGVRSILLKQGEAITKLQANITKAEEFMSIRSQVAKWQTDNKEAITKIRNGEKAGLPAFEVRTADSPMTPSTVNNNTITINPASAIRQGAQVIDIRRAAPTFWDYLTKGSTNLETYPWVNKKVPAESGAAAFIGPGVAKPGVSFKFEVEKSNAKKIAVSMKLATELLDDIDGMTSYVQNELEYQLNIELNSKLMTGTLSSTVPAGIQTFSLGFSTSGLNVVNPNNWDCARAVVAQMRAAHIKGQIVIFMNSIDMANMDMDKAISNGNYTSLSSRPITGATIVEDDNIPVGYLQAFAPDALKTLIYKAFVMKFGWEDDDFTKNLVTVVAETRLHSFHSDNDAAAFVYDDLADIKSQIAAA